MIVNRRRNLVLVTIICFLTYSVLSGLLSQVGILSVAMSEHFSTSTTDAAAQFSYFSTGISLGSLLSLIAFEYLSIRRALIICYLAFGASLLGICLFDHWSSLGGFLLLAGITGNLGVNTGAVTLSIIYQQRYRATMLLMSDICFASAGIVASPTAVLLMQHNLPWHASLWLLCGISILIIVITLLSTFPPTAKESQSLSHHQSWNMTIYLCAFGLFCYIFAQMTMLLWLPYYLNHEIGAGIEGGASAISSYWTGMVIGQILLVFILIRYSSQTLLLVITVASVSLSTGLWLFDKPDQLQFAAFGLGFANAGILKLTIAYGADLIKHPQRVVTLLLFTAACGQALSPAVSASLVKAFGIHFGLQLITIFTLLATIAIIAAILYNTSQQEKQTHVTSSTAP